MYYYNCSILLLVIAVNLLLRLISKLNFIIYIGWINNKVVLYSTGNYIQYSVTNHNGKEYEKEYTYICITESLYCTEKINTTL